MWIKICGIRDVENARRVIPARPDAVGLNFYHGTPRRVSVETAKEVVDILPGSITPVGLFVNHAPAEVDRICRHTGITTIQLHGDETPGFIAEIAAADSNRRILRAFRVDDAGLERMAEDLAAIRQLGVTLAGCLIDARVPGQYGGTGTPAPWDVLRPETRPSDWPPLILAGGLTPANVAAAIQTVQPWGVDVAGGVESATGEKDAELVREFVNIARAAFAQSEG